MRTQSEYVIEGRALKRSARADWPVAFWTARSGTIHLARRMPASPRDEKMILIRFDDSDTKRRALGFLAGRFSFKSWSGGEMAVPEAALAHLATEGIPFSVEGPATYEGLVPTVRDPVSTVV